MGQIHHHHTRRGHYRQPSLTPTHRPESPQPMTDEADYTVRVLLEPIPTHLVELAAEWSSGSGTAFHEIAETGDLVVSPHRHRLPTLNEALTARAHELWVEAHDRFVDLSALWRDIRDQKSEIATTGPDLRDLFAEFMAASVDAGQHWEQEAREASEPWVAPRGTGQ